jgi:hypothetical protein
MNWNLLDDINCLESGVLENSDHSDSYAYFSESGAGDTVT